ncbi:MAG TPA: glycosyltransferase family 9 protein [Firmicutes bacterium]|nr:glycosyltransferase family 9 protein [Bacillota bacterium]
MKTIDLTKVKKILVIRPGAIGDVLLTTPFVRALKKALPGAVIDYAVRPFAAEVLEGNPNIDNIRLIEKRGVISDMKFYRSIAAAKYDIVFDLFGNLRTALITFFSGARYRTGFNFRFRKYFYNVKVVPYPDAVYNVYFHLQLLFPAGIKNDGEETEIFLSEENEAKADEFIGGLRKKNSGSVVGFNPAGTWYTKKWPEKSYSGLGNMIIDEYQEACIVILWGPGEKETALRAAEGIKAKERVFLSPETSLKEMAAMIKKMDVLVSNDGAGKHLAVAVKTPAVTIYGPTNHISWNPGGSGEYPAVFSRESCAPCDRTSCEKFVCMESISPSEVMEKIRTILDREV